MRLFKFITLLICSFTLLVFLPSPDNLAKSEVIDLSSARARIALASNSAPVYKPINGLPTSGDLKFHAAIPETSQRINTEIYSAAMRYAGKMQNYPNKEAGAMSLIAMSTVESMSSSNKDSTIFTTHAVTQEVYRNNPGFLTAFSSDNLYGLAPYDGSSDTYQGPLQINIDLFSNKGIDPKEMGSIGAGSRPRSDHGVKGNRYNWYDACNCIAKVTDVNYGKYKSGVNNGKFSRKVDEQNPYALIAITSVAHNFGSSVFTQKDDKKFTSGPEEATPEFLTEWCNILGSSKVVGSIRESVRQVKPAKYNNSKMVNENIVVPAFKLAVSEAIKSNPEFFSDSRYEGKKKSVYTNPSASYSDLINGSTEKIMFPVKVLTSAIILEERYNGSY